ncbi:MAG: sulfotransferase [Nostocales cyanobacterium 94392]|nr:sulfotransferase [Nostocales cyanobacterium 94392]
MMNNNTQRPIFLVGCPSSGTTLIQSIIDAHPNLSCGQETDFLVEHQKIVSGRYWNKLKFYNSDQEYWHQKIADFFSSFKMDFAQKHGKQRWVDKTPSYTPHLDFIYKLFPDCQIIHTIRDGRDVVKSHRNRWGYKSAVKATYIWQQYIKSAREFGKTLPADQYMEIRYEEMVKQPENNAKLIFEYLQEPWVPQVLQYNETSSHNKDSSYAEYTKKRREQSQDKSLIYRSQVGKGKNLDPFLKSLLYFQSNRLLKELGYL